jgi:hypothetical protein
MKASPASILLNIGNTERIKALHVDERKSAKRTGPNGLGFPSRDPGPIGPVL